MKHFMIKYQFKSGTAEAWHREIVQFITNLDNDPELKGKIAYQCMKEREGPGYYHLAAAADDAANVLQGKEFFKHYAAATRLVGGGEVQVVPLELVAETAFRA